MKELLRRELRVAFSRNAQPVWFRIAKWVVAIAVSVTLFGTRFFWWWIVGGFVAGLTMHCFWRWKTRGWTRPWGGWNDLQE